MVVRASCMIALPVHTAPMHEAHGVSNKSTPCSMSEPTRTGVDISEDQGVGLFSCTICNVTVSSGLYAANFPFCIIIIVYYFGGFCRGRAELSPARSTPSI